MFRGKEVEYGPVLEIFEPAAASVHEGAAGVPAAAGDAVPPAADGRRFHGRPRRDGNDVRIIEKQMDAARLNAAEDARPRAAAAPEVASWRRSGHPWEEGHHAPDTQTVAEGTAPLLARAKTCRSTFRCAAASLARVGRPRAGGRRHQLRRLSRADAGPGRRIGLRQDDDRPGDPAADRADRRARDVTTASTSRQLGGGDLRRMRRQDADHLSGPVRLAQPADDDRVGAHRADGDPGHRQERARERRDRAAALLEGSRPGAALPAALSARVLRRPAAADLHRPGARGRAGVHHLRRIGLGARRLGAGPGAQPAQGAAGASAG